MSFTHATATSRSNFDSIFNTALEAYKKQTKNDLTSHPLLSGLQSCDSPGAILTVLREQIPLFGAQSQSGDDEFSTWLAPTINVLYAFSATLAAGVGIVNASSVLGTIRLTRRIRRYFHQRTLSLQASAFSLRSVSFSSLLRTVFMGKFSRQPTISALVMPGSSNFLAALSSSSSGLRHTRQSHQRRI